MEDNYAVEEFEDIAAAQDERGMTTAEYAVGTVAAATLGGVLIKVCGGPDLFELILAILRWIFTHFTGVQI